MVERSIENGWRMCVCVCVRVPSETDMAVVAHETLLFVRPLEGGQIVTSADLD